LEHDLLNEPIEGCDPAFLFATAEHLGAMHIPGGEVSPSPAPVVFVLELHGLMRLRRQSGMNADSGLDAGLFIGRDDEVVFPEGPTFPGAFI
jgi:hypothetical protein